MAAAEENIFGTKLVGGGEILLGYDDFVRLFDITNMDFAPGLELRTTGVFVVPPPEDLYLTPEERATLTEHPTGNLSEPALPLPCKLSTLEAFADTFGLRAAIEPFTMMQVTNRLTWAYLQTEARTEQGFHTEYFPISGLSGLRRKLRQQHESEANSDKWKVQREVLDALDNLLMPIDNAEGDWDSPIDPKSNPAGKWPWGSHETVLLMKLAAAAERWWKHYDPADKTTAPTNDDVAAWLRNEPHKMSKNLSDAMATILRADDVPAGPRT